MRAVRLRCIARALGTIALGLLVHERGHALGPVAQDVAGDALWAMMIVWWVSALTPHSARLTRTAIALAVCVAVEMSQLSHAPMLMTLRATRLGVLVLGSGFDSRDLAAYAFGVTVAGVIDALLFQRPSAATPDD